MDLTWFELRSVGMEIGTRLRGYYINNVYRAGPLALVLRLRGPEGRESLLVVHTRRAAWITEKVARIQGMDESSRRLRDHLVRLRIGGASAVKNERIIEIQADPDRRIYMEFFGAGNIVVVYSGIIEAALNSFEGRGRSVIPGAPYELPSPRRMIFEIPADQLISAAAESSRSLDRTLGSKFLAPSKYLEEALWRVGLDPNAPANSERLAEELARMYAELTSGTSLYLYRNDGVLEVSASRLRRLEDLYHISPELYESPSEALDAALRAEITEAASTSTDEGFEERRQLEEEARAQEATSEFRRGTPTRSPRRYTGTLRSWNPRPSPSRARRLRCAIARGGWGRNMRVGAPRRNSWHRRGDGTRGTGGSTLAAHCWQWAAGTPRGTRRSYGGTWTRGTSSSTRR